MKENYWVKKINIEELIKKYSYNFDAVFPKNIRWNKEQDLEDDVINFDVDFFDMYPEYIKYSKYIKIDIKTDIKVNNHNGCNQIYISKYTITEKE